MNDVFTFGLARCPGTADRASWPPHPSFNLGRGTLLLLPEVCGVGGRRVVRSSCWFWWDVSVEVFVPVPNVSEGFNWTSYFFCHPFLKTAKTVSLMLLPPNRSRAPAAGAHGKWLLAAM